MQLNLRTGWAKRLSLLVVLLHPYVFPPISLAKGRMLSPSEAGDRVRPNWLECADVLRAPAAAVEAVAKQQILKGSSDREWLLALLAVETAWHPFVVSTAGAIGPAQLMPDGLSDAAAECGLEEPDAEQLQEWRTGVLFGSCLLRQYLRETGGSWPDTLILYNGGYRQLDRWRRAGRMAVETEAYLNLVTQLREQCP